MKTLENFKIATDNNGLQLIQFNTNGNDYPSGLGSYGAINFDTFNDAEQFSRDNGGVVGIFQTRQGHTFWRFEGETDSEFNYFDYLERCGDYLNETTLVNEEENFWDALNYDLQSDCQDYEELKALIKKHDKTIELFENCKDNEVVVYDNNRNILYTLPKKMMQFTEDVFSYSIGVYFNPTLHETNN
jgi:hypothetical protein